MSNSTAAARGERDQFFKLLLEIAATQLGVDHKKPTTTRDYATNPRVEYIGSLSFDDER